MLAAVTIAALVLRITTFDGWDSPEALVQPLLSLRTVTFRYISKASFRFQ